MLYHLVKIAIGEAGDIADIHQADEISQSGSSQSEHVETEEDFSKEPFVMIFDNA